MEETNLRLESLADDCGKSQPLVQYVERESRWQFARNTFARMDVIARCKTP
ncbi:hypothetical protein BN2475_700080 [Paraburkholderia ribeironis]|uniref:Uncharacterized protein n=1 Tax=Paraburkholderia ribeironis TaxID=1247936 RepID=A0A1N7SHS4_9BURK|nr:hypothetical protein [Paraburkholderia ribeironis]SIT46969.1 hypothetical protein BN2475_700080 [Paraburkholderia ribeironis]